MYKIFNKSANSYITCIFADKKLGKQIVEEVTGKKTTEDNLLEVTEEQRDKIQELYAERNTDVVEEVEIKEDVTDELTQQIVELKLDNMKKEQDINSLTEEIVDIKMSLLGGK